MTGQRINRRTFLTACGASIPLLSLACAKDPASPAVDPFAGEPGRLRLTARDPVAGVHLGNNVLIGDGLRRAYLRVPPGYSAAHGAPLIILLHGAGGSGSVMLDAFRSRLDAAGAIGLAPDALNLTWDMLDGGSLFASDIPFVNDMLDQTFARCVVDTNRVALLGFSDGASYALTVGIANADQLRTIVAFSPGTYSVSNPHGTTGVFTAHGTLDPVFPAENAATIDAQLRARGFHVTHDEFDGGHEVPDAVADAAFEWMETQPMTG